jgi:hypothetical protein
VQFDNGNIYCPTYSFQQRISDELKEEVSGDRKAHSLLYDTEIEGGLKIFYTEEHGLMIKFADMMVNLATDKTITISNKTDDEYSTSGNSIVISPDGNLQIDMDTDAIINIGGKSRITSSSEIHLDCNTINLGPNAAEAVIKGNTFQGLFNTHTHIGNLGAPTLPPILPLTGLELSQVSSTQ